MRRTRKHTCPTCNGTGRVARQTVTCDGCKKPVALSNKTGLCLDCLEIRRKDEHARRRAVFAAAVDRGESMAAAGRVFGLSRTRAAGLANGIRRERATSAVRLLAAKRPGPGARGAVEAVAELIYDLPLVVSGEEVSPALRYLREVLGVFAP